MSFFSPRYSLCNPAKSARGFSLVELLIAIAIVAIVVAVAVPAYLNYSNKARISEGMLVLDSIKFRVDELLNTEGEIDPNLLFFQTENLGRYLDKAGINLVYTADGTGAVGVIWVRFNSVVTAAANRCLNFVPQLWNPTINAFDDIYFIKGGKPTPLHSVMNNLTSIYWDCRTPATNGIPTRLLPTNCLGGNIAYTTCPQN